MVDNKKRFLFVFDMDHTILQENSDYEIRDLLPKDKIDQIENLKMIFTDEVNAFFKEFKDNGISTEKVKERINQLSLTFGMREMFDYLEQIKKLRQDIEIEIIVISGANTNYVDWIIEKNNLENIVNERFAFTINDLNGKFIVSPHHVHDCNNCDPFLCKQKVIKDYVNKKSNYQENHYNSICFIGDGSNDFCAGKALSDIKVVDKNHLLVRKDYALYKKLFGKEEKPIQTKYYNELTCNIFVWENGINLLNYSKDNIILI